MSIGGHENIPGKSLWLKIIAMAAACSFTVSALSFAEGSSSDILRPQSAASRPSRQQTEQAGGAAAGVISNSNSQHMQDQPYAEFLRQISGKHMPLADELLSAHTADDLDLNKLVQDPMTATYSGQMAVDPIVKYFAKTANYDLKFLPDLGQSILKVRSAHPFRLTKMINQSHRAIERILAMSDDERHSLLMTINEFY